MVAFLLKGHDLVLVAKIITLNSEKKTVFEYK